MAMYMSSKKTLEINPTNPIMEELRKRSEVGAAALGRAVLTPPACQRLPQATPLLQQPSRPGARQCAEH